MTHLSSVDDSPTILAQVWVRGVGAGDANKQVWRKQYLLLRDGCLYICEKLQVLAKILRQNRRLDPLLLTPTAHGLRKA
ncbi:hypothetical protein ONE63_001856 [Megalurothrips usitatus]|uniref:PH domain-containing protein n=1 Tax=Megalurothrips usitatus TaxID=439358 RepID=A0AAV7XDW2_9NEOP|nr:hypothetical protein ONE63_001856 [Megalurothrips usitatus]